MNDDKHIDASVKACLFMLIVTTAGWMISITFMMAGQHALETRVNDLNATVVDLSKLVVQQQEIITRTGNNVNDLVGLLEYVKTIDEYQNKSIEALAMR